MILIDPDLDPDPNTRTNVVAPLAVRKRSSVPWPLRIPTKPTLTRFLTEAQDAVRLRGEVTVLLTTDLAIRRLNRQFRGMNKATDVLSFPAEGVGAEEMAGDLAISVETARRQAAGQGHALTCELKVLILHGLLHLAGHDHEADNGRMARREQKLRAQLRLPWGLIERAESPRVIEKHPPGAKARIVVGARAARLKSCPVTKPGSSRAERIKSRPEKKQELGPESLRFEVSHPSDKNKDVARVGHPTFVRKSAPASSAAGRPRRWRTTAKPGSAHAALSPEGTPPRPIKTAAKVGRR